MNYPILIASRTGFTAVGVRVTVPTMDELGPAVLEARRLLQQRMHEIELVRDAHTVYGISPPNYKGNPGPFDFYVCVEVERLERLPHGMVHLRLQPKLYAEVEYRGLSRTATGHTILRRTGSARTATNMTIRNIITRRMTSA